MVRDSAKEKVNREVQQKAWEEAGRNVNDFHPTRVLRSRKLLAAKQPDFPHRSPQNNDRGADHRTRVNADAVVDSNTTGEGEGDVILFGQAQNDRDKPKGHVVSEINPSIEGSDHKVEAGKTNVEIEAVSGKVRRARKRKTIAEDRNKVFGIADQVQENLQKSKVGKCKVVNESITKAKPRKPPWNKGLKKKKALANGETRNSAIIAAVEEIAHDENITYCDEEDTENIVHNTKNFGEQITDSAGLAGDEESGVYIDRVSHDANYGHNIGGLSIDVTGLASDRETVVYKDRVSRDSDDEHNFRQPNTDFICLADDEDSGVYNDRVSRDSDDEQIFGELNTDVTGLAEDEESVMYNDRISRDTDEEHNFGELNTDAVGVSDKEDAGAYNLGSSRGSGDEVDVGELHTDAAGSVDNEGSGVYYHRDSRHYGDEYIIAELHTDAAGVADDEDDAAYHHGDFGDCSDDDDFGKLNNNVAGVADDQELGEYHDGAFRDSSEEDNVGELTIDATSVVDDDDDSGVYHHMAFRGSGDENNVGELNTDDASVADDSDDDNGVYHQGAFRDFSNENNVHELNTEDARVFHHGTAGDENNVGDLIEENTGVYQHRAFCDSGDEDDLDEPATASAGIVDDGDTELFHHRPIRDASLQLHVGELGDVTSVREDEVRIHNNQAFHQPSDEPMGDVPGDPFDHFSPDKSSDLTSYSAGSHSPNIIAKVVGCPEGYIGMKLSDQTMGEPLGSSFSDVKDVAMGEGENGTENCAEDGQGVIALPTASRRNRKRKVSESDNVTANDGTVTIDEKKVVIAKQVAKPKKPTRKRKAPTSERIADTEGNIDHDDMRIDNSHQVTDAKTTKSSRKRRAPLGGTSGKDEPVFERKNEQEFGADGKNKAAIRGSSKGVPVHYSALHLIHETTPATTTIVKQSTRKQFWYYQPIADDEPKPVNIMQRDEQLGSKRASRMRRSSRNDYGNENSAREHSVAAQKRDQKPKTFTHDTRDTGKELAMKKATVAGNTISRRRNTDNNSTTKQTKAYPEDVSMMTDKFEAGLAEEPQAQGLNTIGEARILSGNMPGFRDDKVERAQDQPSVFPNLSLNQGAIAMKMEKPTRASKLIQRKRAPKKEPLVRSDARPRVLKVANKNQVASRPRKRKPTIKTKFPAQVESSSSLGDEAFAEEPGPSIAANKTTRKRVPTDSKYFLSPQCLSLHDEDERDDASRVEQANSRRADNASQMPKALTDDEFADNDGHVNGGLKSYAGWDSEGGNPKAPESGFDFSPGKKNPKKVAKPKVDIWDYDYLVTNHNSQLVKVDLLSLFQKPETWALLSQEELEELQPHFPEYVPRNDDNLTISTDWLRNDVDWRHSVRAWQAELGGGFFDPKWQKHAAAASAERAAGKFDKWKEAEFEEFWGQKQALPNLTSS